MYNLPKWNVHLGSYLAGAGMTFRHWVAINIKLTLPIPGRLYPSHYTYDVCERLNRHWTGMDLESCDVIVERLQTEGLRPHKSDDFIG